MAGIKKFNWVQRPSTWAYAQAWKSQRSQMAQQFLSEGNAAASAFAGAQNNLASGMATITAEAAIKAAQKQLEAAKTRMTSSINTLA
jgi:hypothetical protein